MKQYDTITTDNVNFDDAILTVFEQLNELKRSNQTITYEDIDITFSLFRRIWVVLVYSYDDEMFGIPAMLTPGEIIATKEPLKFIGMPAHISPSDPDWRSKLEEWQLTQSPTTQQETPRATETEK